MKWQFGKSLKPRNQETEKQTRILVIKTSKNQDTLHLFHFQVRESPAPLNIPHPCTLAYRKSRKIREKLRIWGHGEWGRILIVNILKRIAQKLHRINLLHIGPVTSNFHFPTPAPSARLADAAGTRPTSSAFTCIRIHFDGSCKD